MCVREKEGERDVARITFVRNDSSTELDKEKMRQRGGGLERRPFSFKMEEKLS